MKVSIDKNIVMLSLNKYEEIIDSITTISKKLKLKSGIVINISGELNRIKLFHYNSNENDKKIMEIDGKLTITSASGYIAIFGKEVEPTILMNVADENGNVVGGYVSEAIVENSVEIFILVPAKTIFEKRFDVKSERLKLEMKSYELEF